MFEVYFQIFLLRSLLSKILVSILNLRLLSSRVVLEVQSLLVIHEYRSVPLIPHFLKLIYLQPMMNEEKPCSWKSHHPLWKFLYVNPYQTKLILGHLIEFWVIRRVRFNPHISCSTCNIIKHGPNNILTILSPWINWIS